MAQFEGFEGTLVFFRYSPTLFGVIYSVTSNKIINILITKGIT